MRAAPGSAARTGYTTGTTAAVKWVRAHTRREKAYRVGDGSGQHWAGGGQHVRVVSTRDESLGCHEP